MIGQGSPREGFELNPDRIPFLKLGGVMNCGEQNVPGEIVQKSVVATLKTRREIRPLHRLAVRSQIKKLAAEGKISDEQATRAFHDHLVFEAICEGAVEAHDNQLEQSGDVQAESFGEIFKKFGEFLVAHPEIIVKIIELLLASA